MTASFQIRLCQNPTCGLRYPLTEGHPFGNRCPICLSQTHLILERSLDPEPGSPFKRPHPRLSALLDNIRSAWNVGAIFRTADGIGVSKLHLCGITPTPDNKEIRKTALGAETIIPWDYAPNALHKAETLKASGARLWALEQDPRATTDFSTDLIPDTQIETDLVLIVGNEVTGVDPALLDLCERIVQIPMHGQKRSLNVEVAFGIAADRILR